MNRPIQDIFRSYGTTDEHGNHLDGTDKATNHNYGPVYDLLFPDREAVRLVLEVGVSRGGSMMAWCEIFPNAHVVGMDVDDNCVAKGTCIEHHVGDCRNSEDCEEATAGRLFDLVVDDADHNVSTTVAALNNLWSSVAPGGLYVVEDFAQGPLCRLPVTDEVAAFRTLFPAVEVYDTWGPRGGWEPVLVLRKPK